MRVYVNSTGVDVPDGATALEAVRCWNALEAEALAAGHRRLTDSRGLPAAPEAPAYGGAIFRVLPVRRGPAEGDADVDAAEPST